MYSFGCLFCLIPQSSCSNTPVTREHSDFMHLINFQIFGYWCPFKENNLLLKSLDILFYPWFTIYGGPIHVSMSWIKSWDIRRNLAIAWSFCCWAALRRRIGRRLIHMFDQNIQPKGWLHLRLCIWGVTSSWTSSKGNRANVSSRPQKSLNSSLCWYKLESPRFWIFLHVDSVG